MDYYYFSEVSPEKFDPVLGIILAVLAWSVLFISLRRSAVRERKAERLHSETMANLRQNYLRKPQI